MLLDDLSRALMELPHTGPKGFEGLVRDALAELTGQGFRLMKSGPQGGVDMIGDPRGSGLVIGMEGKHYGADTRLPLDGLKSKLREAVEIFPAMDLWLLATTRSIDGGDAKSLRELGISLGVEVMILDWSIDGALPPPLATLCAAAPVAMAHHLGAAANLAIAAICAGPYFVSEADRIRSELRSASVGLAAAHEALRNWIRGHLRDAASARMAFDSYATLEAPQVIRIPRPSIAARLDTWWQAGPTSVATLLGQEGMGKTWAAVSWWLDREAARSDLPLTLVVPARDVDSFDGPALLATALHKATELRDVGFWQRRLARWTTLEVPRPFILLIIDGLNQKWQFTEWSDLLVSLATPLWAGRVAVVLTCRPDHWTQRLKSLAECPVPISPIQIDPFDDAELNALLSLHGVEREALSHAVLPLIRVPRLSRLAIERRAELQGGDVTPERLVYEDWRHRHHRAQQTFSHSDFQAFVSELGREIDGQLRLCLTRAELLDRLSADGGLPRERFEGVLSELIDGGWLEPSEDARRFQLKSERVPAALGLTLLDAMRQAASDDAREEVFAHRLDPLQGSDVSVAILRHAATFAILDTNTPENLRRLLLDRWTKAQNFAPRDFESFWRLIGCAPKLFMDLIEADWFEGEGSGREDEILVKGVANAWRWSDVATLCETRLVSWFSRYWLDPLEGEVLGRVPDDEQAARRREATCVRAAAAHAENLGPRFGLTLIEVAPERQAWGSYRATELLSWLPRAPLIQVFTAWALSRAILGGWRQFDSLAWVLRWNVEDFEPTEAALITRADELIAAGDEIAKDAAKSLLEALASPRAMAHRDKIFGAQAFAAKLPVSWPQPLADQRFSIQPLATVGFLDADPCDPRLVLPKDWIARLEHLATETSDAALLIEGTERDPALNRANLALARWAPNQLAQLERRRAQAAAAASHLPQRLGIGVRLWRWLHGRRSTESKRNIVGSRSTYAAISVLDDETLALWRKVGARAHELGLAPEFARDSAAFVDVGATGQILLLKRNTPSWVPPDARRLLKVAASEDLPLLAAELESSRAPEHLCGWLNYIAQVAIAVLPGGWLPLARLLNHEDASVRARAFQFVWELKDRKLADVLEQTGWRFASTMQREEVAWGSLALSLSSAAEAGNISGRVHPEAYRQLSELYPEICVYRGLFADHVFSELEYLQTAKSRSFPRALFSGGRGWTQLIEDHGAALIAWMRPFTHPDEHEVIWGLVEEFPILDALDAVDLLSPGSKARAITAGLRENQGSSLRYGQLYDLATRLRGASGEEARQIALNAASDDKKLFEFALGIQENDQTDWLVAQIEFDLASPVSGKIARGLTLGGFLVPGSAADRLWNGILASPPSTGWLQAVHAIAHTRYRQFSWAQHWSALLQTTDNIEIAFAAHALLAACVDERFYLGEHRPKPDVIASWGWRKAHLWTSGWNKIQAAIKKHKDKLEKTWLGCDPPLSNQFPRRR